MGEAGAGLAWACLWQPWAQFFFFFFFFMYMTCIAALPWAAAAGALRWGLGRGQATLDVGCPQELVREHNKRSERICSFVGCPEQLSRRMLL